MFHSYYTECVELYSNHQVFIEMQMSNVSWCYYVLVSDWPECWLIDIFEHAQLTTNTLLRSLLLLFQHNFISLMLSQPKQCEVSETTRLLPFRRCKKENAGKLRSEQQRDVCTFGQSTSAAVSTENWQNLLQIDLHPQQTLYANCHLMSTLLQPVQ